ncbi:MAG: hypothetical protein AAB596_00470 [Patescibacteria group bacterium]
MEEIKETKGGIEVRETARSLKNKFIALVQKYCPNFQVDDGIENLAFFKKESLFSKIFIGKEKSVMYVFRLDGNIGGLDLFEAGEWSDIKIVAEEEKYLVGVIKIAGEYGKISGKRVVIDRSF